MIAFDKNEKVDVWVQVTERDAGTVTFSTYVFEVFDLDDDTVQAEATASLSGNGTATAFIYGLVDTTASGFVAGSQYNVRFTYTIGSEQYIDVIPIKLIGETAGVIVPYAEVVAFTEQEDIIETIHDGVEAAVENYCHRTFSSTTYLHELHNGNGTPDMFLNHYPIISITQVAIGEMAAIKVKNTATDATRATVTVSADDAEMTLIVAGGDSASTDTIDLSNASYDTIDEVVTQINTLGDGWSAETNDTNFGSLLSSELLPVMAHQVGSRGNQVADWSYLNMPNLVISAKHNAVNAQLHYPGIFTPGFQNIIITYTAGYTSATMPKDLKLAILSWVKSIYTQTLEDSEGIKKYTTGDLSVTYGDSITMETKTILNSYIKAVFA